MKTLFIVRHAKSSWNSPYLSDFERPLNGRGKRNLPEMAKRFEETRQTVDLIISSTAVRALTTAKGFAAQLRIPVDRFFEEEDLYHASAQAMKQRLSKLGNKYGSVMIFGHNPGLTSLINSLSYFDLYSLPTCAICGIRFQFDTWDAIIKTKGEKFYYDYPKSRE